MNNEDKLTTKIKEILKGIDELELDGNDGWWETSKGVEFGYNKLEDVLVAIEDHLELVRDSECKNIEAMIRERYRQKIFIFYGAAGVNNIENAYSSKYPSPHKQPKE